MATITVTVGPITSTKTANNAMAQEIILDYIASQRGPIHGTDQEKVDWFLRDLMQTVKFLANGYRQKVLQDEATRNAGLDNRGWT